MTQRYDPHKHHRRSIRLKAWDYTSPAAYFVTICTHQRQNLFDDERYRQVVENSWQAIPNRPHAQHVTLDEWVVMPNHLHGIIVMREPTINGRGGASADDIFKSEAGSLKDASPPILEGESKHEVSSSLTPSLQNAAAGSLGVIIGNFKSVVTRRINQLRDAPGAKVWQRGYYERVVRNDRELNAIRKYIKDNPCRWSEDSENLDMIIARMDMMR
jgi:REP element-mobilizing transposase RayT